MSTALAVNSVLSISALKLEPAPTSGSPSMEVLGYHTPGDEGGGYFYWDPTSTATDDGGSVITPTPPPANGRWIQVFPEGIVSAKQFGAWGDGSPSHDDTAAVLAAMKYCNTANITLHFPAGVYRIPTFGTYTASGDLKLSGDGSDFTFLDASVTSGNPSAKIELTPSIKNVDIRGVTFKYFDKPIHAGVPQPPVTAQPILDSLTLIDFNATGGCNGAWAICFIERAFISRYRASDLTGVDPQEGTYGLALGHDCGTTEHTCSYFIEDVYIKNVDGSVHADQVPTNAIAIRGHRLTLNKFRLENVHGDTLSTDCEGFYAKVQYSEISNGYLYNAGHDEASFIIKNIDGLNPQCLGKSAVSHDNVVRNVHVRCDTTVDHAVYRGFVWECGSVFAENCVAEGVEYEGFAVSPYPVPPDSSTTVPLGPEYTFRYTFNNCWTINSNARSSFVVNGGDVELINCGLALSTAASTTARSLSFLLVPNYATRDVSLKLVGCRMRVPASYNAVQDTNAIWLSHPPAVSVNRIQIDDFLMDDKSTTPPFRRGVTVTSSPPVGPIKEVFIDRPRFDGITDVEQSVNLHGLETALSITNWGEQTHFAMPDISGLVGVPLTESCAGKILNSSLFSTGRNCTLPAAFPGMRVGFWSPPSSYPITIKVFSGDTINGSTSFTVPVNTYVVLECVAAKTWMVK